MKMPSELHATQGLKSLDHWDHSPGLDLLLEFLFKLLEAFGMLAHGPDILLEDDLLHRGGTDQFRGSLEMGRAPRARPV
jgi:hypothetical protein